MSIGDLCHMASTEDFMGLLTRAVISLTLFALAVPAGVSAQVHWSPKLGAGITQWLPDVGDDSAPVGIAGRAQLLRSTEGLFAWGPEVSFYSFGTFVGDEICATPECSVWIPINHFSVYALTAGLASRVGKRGGRRGVFGAFGLAWTSLWEDGKEGREDESYQGLTADLGLGYAFSTRPGLFVELRGHGLIAGGNDVVGLGVYWSLMGGVSF